MVNLCQMRYRVTIGKWLWRTPLQHLIYCRCSTGEGKKVIVTIDLILFKVSLLDDEEPDENWSMSVNLDMLSLSLSSFDLSSTQSSLPVEDKVEEQSVLSAAVAPVEGIVVTCSGSTMATNNIATRGSAITLGMASSTSATRAVSITWGKWIC